MRPVVPVLPATGLPGAAPDGLQLRMRADYKFADEPSAERRNIRRAADSGEGQIKVSESNTCLNLKYGDRFVV
jgi:hypothetical protein